MYDPHPVCVNVGSLAAAAGTVYVPIFYNPAGNGRITIIHASTTLVPTGTCTLNLVDLGDGTGGTMTNSGTLYTLGSGGTETVYGAGTPIEGTEVSAQLAAGHWLGVKSEKGTASTVTLVEFSYLKGVTGA